VRILLICPIPIEYMMCRSVLALRDGQPVQGCRAAHGSVGNVDIMAIETGPAKARAAAATVAGIDVFAPDLALDTGTCGALNGDLIVRAVDLYRFVRYGLESGWFASFHKLWEAVPRGHVERMPQRALP
jgi:nucleoside phosphorylase